MSKRPDVLLFLILGVAAWLRLYHLGASSLWTDEARVALNALRPLPAVLLHWPSALEPPFSYLIQHVMSLFSTAEAWLRLPALLASLATVGLTCIVGTTLFTRRVGLLAAAMLAVSPLDIRYAQEVRYYSLFAAGFMLATLAFFRMAQGQRAARLYLLASLWLALTNIFAVAVWLVHGLTLAAMGWRAHLTAAARRQMVQVLLVGALMLVLVYGVGLAMRGQPFINPLPSSPIRSPIKMGAGDGSASFTPMTWFWDVYYRTFKWFATPSDLPRTQHMTLLGIPSGYRWPLRAFGLLVGLALVGGWRWYGENLLWVLWHLLALLTLLAIATEMLGPSFGIFAFAVRRLLFLLPLFWLLVAVGCEVVGRWATQGFAGRYVATAIAWTVAIILCGGVAFSILPGYYRWRKDDWRGAALVLQRAVTPGEAVVCCTSWQSDPLYEWAPLSFYLRDWPLREQMVLLKGASTPMLPDAPTLWHIAYGEPPARLEGYRLRERIFIGPYWIWLTRWERLPR